MDVVEATPHSGAGFAFRLAFGFTMGGHMRSQAVVRCMTRCVFAILIGAHAGCTGNPSRFESPQPTAANRERVVDRNAWLSVNDAPLQYRHISEGSRIGLYQILISDRGDYCVVDAAAYTVARDGELWTCDWRAQRP